MKKNIIVFLHILFYCLNLNAEPLDLYDCISSCLKNSPTTKRYRHLIHETEHEIDYVRSSFYPHISLFGNYTHEYYKDSGNADNYYVGINFSQLIFSGFKRMNNYKIAKLQKSISIYNYNEVIKQLVYQIKENYFQILMYKNQIKLLDKIIKRRKNNLTIIKLRYTAGRESSISVMEIESDLNISKHEKLTRIEALDYSKKNLAVLMGEKHDFQFEIKDSEDSFPDYSYDETLQDGKNNSIELNANELELQIEKHRLNSAKGEYYYPEVNLSSRYGFSENKFFPEKKHFIIGLSISYPIFTGYSTSSIVNRINSRIKSIEEARKEIIYNIEININGILNKYRLLIKEQEILKIKYKSALANYRLLKLEYQQGKISYLWLKERENTLADIELENEDVIYNIRITLAELERIIKALAL